jgi:hypothetical protein
MLYLILGIVLGAAFHEFWTELFDRCRNKINDWTRSPVQGDGSVVEGEVVQEAANPSSSKEAPAS